MVKIRAPLSVTLEITGCCNMDCIYCFSHPVKKEYISISEVTKIIDMLVDLGVFRIELSGGEPFLHPEIFNILGHIQKYNGTIRWSVSSNGILFANKSFVKKLVKIIKADSLVHHLQVSIDSHLSEYNDITRGKTEIVLQGIDNLLKANVNFTLATVVHSQNYRVADSLIDYFYIRGIKSYHFMNFMPTIKAMERDLVKKLSLLPEKQDMFWESMENKYKNNTDIHIDTPLHEVNPTKEGARITEEISCKRCTAGFTHITITPDLDVLPCSTARHIIMGNIQKDSLDDVWNSTAAENVRECKSNPCQANLLIKRGNVK